jgi:hypothetical protein
MNKQTQSQQIVANIAHKHQHGPSDTVAEALCALALALCALCLTILFFSL